MKTGADKDNSSRVKAPDKTDMKPMIDENMHLFVYGNLLIKDVETGETLVNKRI